MQPETGAYTISIESLYEKFKKGHKSRYGTERALLNSYMDEFIWKKVYVGNALYHLCSQIAEHYPPPSGLVWKCMIIFWLLIGLPYDSPIFGNSSVWRALMQLFFQVFRPEGEAKYEYKCNVSVNAETHAKLSFLPLVRTNHQPLFDVLHHLPLHLTPLVSVTAPQTFLRSIASFASNYCSTLPNNLLLQKVKPVYNVSQ